MTDTTFQIIYDSRRQVYLLIGNSSFECYGKYKDFEEAENRKHNLERGERT